MVTRLPIKQFNGKRIQRLKLWYSGTSITLVQYKGGVERRVTDEDTSAVHYEFGRYCPKDYIIKVTIIAGNNGVRVDELDRTAAYRLSEPME